MGSLLAAVAGVGFGLFQTVNRRAIQDLDVYQSTFIQLLISSVILAALWLGVEDVGDLWQASAGALGNFAAAGVIHFFVGWTLLNASQKRLGAARTSPLLATVPLFGTVIAAVTIQEVPGALTLVGVGLTVAGAYVIGVRPRQEVPVPAVGGERGAWRPDPDEGGSSSPRQAWRGTLYALATALAWATSPIFIRRGLEELDSPLLGVTLGMVTSTTAYGLVLVIRRLGRPSASEVSRRALPWKLAAGVLVGLSTWARWYALDLAPVAVVLALGLLSVPTVMALAPVLMGRHLERVTRPLLAGSGLIVAGSMVLILRA